jgi:small neutral amino acid transporter SnatA (MarC family)
VNEWIVVLAVIGALGPARIAAAAPDERPGRLPAALAIVAVVAVALAAAGRSVLDALDVSEPNAAIAAGLVLAVTGLVDLVRPRTDPVVVADGPVAALVPLAWPVAFRPALFLLALAAGPVVGVVPVLAGVVLAAGLATVLAALRPAPPVPTGAHVLVGAVAIATALDLLIDGVLAV